MPKRYLADPQQVRERVKNTQTLARLRASPLLLLIVLDAHLVTRREASRPVACSTSELNKLVPELSRRTVERAIRDLVSVGALRPVAAPRHV